MPQQTEIDELIEQLKNDPVITKAANKKDTETVLTEDTLERFLFEKAQCLIKNGVDSIEDLRDSIRQGINPEEVLAYSDLIKATGNILEVVNKINLQKRKAKTALQLKEIDAQNKRNLPGGNTTNVLIATRDEVFNKIIDKIQKRVEQPVQATLIDEENQSVINVEPELEET